MHRRTMMWATLALFGIVATATLAWVAGQIAGQRIGMASEPLSVASTLAPAAQSQERQARPAHNVKRRRAARAREAAHPTAAPGPAVASLPVTQSASAATAAPAPAPTPVPTPTPSVASAPGAAATASQTASSNPQPTQSGSAASSATRTPSSSSHSGDDTQDHTSSHRDD